MRSTNIKVYYYWYGVFYLLLDKIRLGICFFFFLGRLGSFLCLGVKIVFIKIEQSFFSKERRYNEASMWVLLSSLFWLNFIFSQAKDSLFAA